MSNPSNCFKIVDSFCCGANWQYRDKLKKKNIHFAFKPSVEEEKHWKDIGFKKLTHLLMFLKKAHHGLDNFDLVFFRGSHSQDYYTKVEHGKPIISVNIDRYLEYGVELNSALNELKIQKYARKISHEYSEKVPEKFFNGESKKSLIRELKKSNYTILENLIKEFDKMSVRQKRDLKRAFEHSKMGTEIIKEYIDLNPEAPKIQLKKFIEVIEKLGEEEVGELLTSILKSKKSRLFIKQLSKLSIKEQNKIFKKLPEMSKMLDRYEKLQVSLREFKKKIKEHKNSPRKDEKDIHKFLAKHYWLLGIEYFDKQIFSDITPEGELTGDTKIGKRKHADFVIERINGLDKCVLIELEEANDLIFNKDGSLSKEVYDGIHQAVDYYIEKKSKNINSKGLAVIGSIMGERLTAEQKKKLILLKETFHNVEVLTYDDIIEKADNTINFWKSYAPKS